MDEPADPESNPFGRVVSHWDRVIDDMAATATQYRDAGREAIELHPGDVALLTDESDDGRLGFDVVVPGDDFKRVTDALDGRTVDRDEVFRAVGDGLVFLLIALECGDDLAVLVPLYYDRSDEAALRELAADRGVPSHIRPLDDEAGVTVVHDDPEAFFPEGD